MPMLAKTILLLSLFTLTWAGHGFAQTAGVTMTTYYPSPFGEYTTLRLLPRAGDLTNPCTVGSLYVNSSGVLQYCYRQGSSGVWGAPSEVWNQSGDDIFLTDTTVNPNLRVGIGTTAPEFKLSVMNDGGIIAKGGTGASTLSLGAGTRLMWNPGQPAFRAGHVTGDQWDEINTGFYSIAMGLDTIASGYVSVVGGGALNTAGGEYSTVSGGKQNTASGNYSAIVGGESNTASGSHSTVSGGYSSATAANATIVGGYTNQATEDAATVGGGVQNTASNLYSIVAGGYQNTASGAYSVVGGGDRNSASVGNYTIVSGGSQNTASATSAGITGGWNNVASGAYSHIGGGVNNIASGLRSTVAGGRYHTASGDYSTVAGGKGNTASGMYSAIPGGKSNVAHGYAASILIGDANVTHGDYSLVGGRYMQLGNNADNSFLWGHAASIISPIETPDAFIIYSGKVSIHEETPSALLEISNSGAATDDYLAITSNPAIPADVLIVKNSGLIGVGQSAPLHPLHFGNGAYLSLGGIWVDGSSRDYKENIAPLDPDRAVAALKELSPVQYNYKNSPGERHAGFVAEKVPDLVADRSRQELTPMDFVAVLTRVIQNQQQEIEDQDKKLNQLKQEIQKLKEQHND